MRFIVLLLLTLTTIGSSMDKDALFKVLEELEGSSDSRITKTEVGRYCITEAFFLDAKEQLQKEGRHFLHLKWSDLTNHNWSHLLTEAYWRRYCPKALQSGDIKVLAAVFRKGPRGFQNPTGISYGKRAQNLYYEYSKGRHKGSVIRKK